MGADISQFKQAELVRHIPDLTKIEEHGDGEGTGKFSIKNHSKSFAHFSDYSMFPDRYNVKSSPKAILGNALFVATGGPPPTRKSLTQSPYTRGFLRNDIFLSPKIRVMRDPLYTVPNKPTFAFINFGNILTPCAYNIPYFLNQCPPLNNVPP